MRRAVIDGRRGGIPAEVQSDPDDQRNGQEVAQQDELGDGAAGHATPLRADRIAGPFEAQFNSSLRDELRVLSVFVG